MFSRQNVTWRTCTSQKVIELKIVFSYDLFLEASDSTFDDNGDAPIYFDGLVEIEIVSTTSKPCIQLHADEMTVLDVLVLLEGTGKRETVPEFPVFICLTVTLLIHKRYTL